MCFDLDSEPPIPVIRGATVAHEDVVLTAADGTQLAAFLAVAETPSANGIVILPDVRGLYRFYEELALRFAERGMTAAAFDYFGRTAGVSRRDDDFPYMDHVARTTPEGVQQDVRAAVGLLRSRGAESIFTVGFCFGGRHSWLSAAAGHGLAGAIGFYGMPLERNGNPGPADCAAEIVAPILALQAGDDPHIPPEQNDAFRRALEQAGVDHELVVYDRAPHSFFDRRQEDFLADSEDAWNRVLAFIDRHGA